MIEETETDIVISSGLIFRAIKTAREKLKLLPKERQYLLERRDTKKLTETLNKILKGTLGMESILNSLEMRKKLLETQEEQIKELEGEA